MTKALVHWTQMNAPVTSSERISFLTACQREFQATKTAAHVCGTLAPCPAGSSSPRDPSASTFLAMDNDATPVMHPRCHTCRASAFRATIANPFSDWALVLCPVCESSIAPQLCQDTSAHSHAPP